MQTKKLFIPDKCKAGFNLRSETYTGKLAYVIGFDGKKWRKEPSWKSWSNFPGDKKYAYRSEKTTYYGDEVAPMEFENVPTEGFVLNKKAGGTKYSWNHRATYARIYDPRGFEFEITIQNLLFVLQETDCMKGKGLVGEFVYSWDGKDLVLLPCDCEDYKASREFTNLQDKKISARDLVVGATYQSKKDRELIYLGRYERFVRPDGISNYYGELREDKFKKGFNHKNKAHVFWDVKSKRFEYNCAPKLANCLSEDMHPDCVKYQEKYLSSASYKPKFVFADLDKKMHYSYGYGDAGIYHDNGDYYLVQRQKASTGYWGKRCGEYYAQAVFKVNLSDSEVSFEEVDKIPSGITQQAKTLECPSYEIVAKGKKEKIVIL